MVPYSKIMIHSVVIWERIATLIILMVETNNGKAVINWLFWKPNRDFMRKTHIIYLLRLLTMLMPKIKRQKICRGSWGFKNPRSRCVSPLYTWRRLKKNGWKTKMNCFQDFKNYCQCTLRWKDRRYDDSESWINDKRLREIIIILLVGIFIHDIWFV